MAQEVGYFKNNVEFIEGPFVIVSVSDQWRIEAELKEHHCSVLPDDSIYPMIREIVHQLRPIARMLNWGTGLNGTRDEAAKVCDILNARAKFGVIRLEGRAWVAS